MNEYELYHHGILGMKWGIRRYQPYPDGHVSGKEVGEAARKPNSRKKFTKQQKANIAIGIGTAVAIGGLTYVSLKQRKKIIEMGKEYTKMVADRDRWSMLQTQAAVRAHNIRTFAEENGLEIPLYLLKHQ